MAGTPEGARWANERRSAEARRGDEGKLRGGDEADETCGAEETTRCETEVLRVGRSQLGCSGETSVAKCEREDALVRREEDDRLRVERVDLGADALERRGVDVVTCREEKRQRSARATARGEGAGGGGWVGRTLLDKVDGQRLPEAVLDAGVLCPALDLPQLALVLLLELPPTLLAPEPELHLDLGLPVGLDRVLVPRVRLDAGLVPRKGAAPPLADLGRVEGVRGEEGEARRDTRREDGRQEG